MAATSAVGPSPSGTLSDLLDACPLRREHVRVWLLSAMGVMLDGFDFFIMGVAIPLIAQEWALGSWAKGAITGAAILGAMVGAGTIGRLTDRYGRKLVFKVDLAMFVVFAVLSAVSPNVWFLIAFRFLLGIGIGADYPISASYVAEIAPAKHRSRLLVGAFAFQAVGQLLGVVVGLIVLNVYPEPNAWRWMLLFGVVPAGLIVYLRRGVPESPRWLASKGDVEDAREVCEYFLREPVSADQVLAYAEAAQAAGERSVRYRSLFGARFRNRTILTTVPWFLMDIATYGVGVFTPTIIAAIFVTSADSSFIASDIASTKGAAFVDLFLIVGFALALLLINRVQHARLQIYGFLGMIAGLLVLAYVSSLPGGGDEHFALLFVGFAGLNLCMNMGPNTTTYVLPAEVYPTSVRATGHGFAAACGKAGAAVGTFFFPALQSGLGLAWTMVLIAGGCTVALAVTAAFASSARDRSASEK